MDGLIIINEIFTAVFDILESISTNVVTYTIYKASDSTVFASGNASFIAGINWKVTFTPAAEETYIVEVNNQTLAAKYSKNFRAVNSSSRTQELETTPVTVTNATLLAKVDAAISARLSGGAVQSYSIKGRNIQYATLTELYKLKRDLEKAISAASGSGGRNCVKFVRPT